MGTRKTIFSSETPRGSKVEVTKFTPDTVQSLVGLESDYNVKIGKTSTMREPANQENLSKAINQAVKATKK